MYSSVDGATTILKAPASPYSARAGRADREGAPGQSEGERGAAGELKNE